MAATPEETLARLREPRLSLCGTGEDSVSAVCGVAKQTALDWRDRGLRGRKLPTFRVGRRCFVLVRELTAFLEAADEAPEVEPAAESTRPTRAAERQDAALAGAGW